MIPDSRYMLKLLISVSLILTGALFGQAQNQKKKDADAWKYMHMLSPDEMNVKVKIDKDYKATDPPPSPVESLAEFEPMAGALIRYPLGINYFLIKSLAQLDTVYTIVANESEEQTARNIYNSSGIDLSHCKFIHAKSDSYWTRDYGPMFTAGKDLIGITDFTYNRPRPNDNTIPQKIAETYGFPYYEMDLVHTGGNYMSDGYGIAASTQIAYTKNGVSQEDVNKKMKDYLGIHTYHVVQDPNNTGMNHIDCWGKFLDVDKILIRSVPQSHHQYDEIEATADYFKNQKSSRGNNYQVFRVYTPNNEPYTNSFILNKRVFVPIMNSQWDNDALQVYKDAMPGYEISGYEEGSWGSDDALHCRVHEMADKQMVRIKHIPIRGAQGTKSDFTFKAAIKAYSGKPFKQDSVRVFYKVNFGEWQSKKMLEVSTDTFSVDISALTPNQTIQYYLYAADQAGKRANLPLVGAAAPFTFVTSDNYTASETLDSEPSVNVYPNPANDYLNISYKKAFGDNLKIEILNSAGQLIKQESISHTENLRLNIRDLKKGMYILRICTPEKSVVSKFVKK